MSLFITFEGGEGSGKSTQARLLLKRLEHENVPAVLTHEPGGTTLGDEMRKLLKKRRDSSISPWAELFLFAASRVQLVAELIGPALQAGYAVICDRFIHSTVAYQAYGRGLDLATVEAISALAIGDLRPDLTILLDMPSELGLERKRTLRDRFETEDLSFHRRVRDGYRAMAASDPDRWLVIDASLGRTEVADKIWDRVGTLLSTSR